MMVFTGSNKSRSPLPSYIIDYLFSLLPSVGYLLIIKTCKQGYLEEESYSSAVDVLFTFWIVMSD